MALLLNVPYDEKEQAKVLGARWNPELKKWYISEKNLYHNFKKWFNDIKSNIIVCQQIYVVEAERKCFRCGRNTPVISLGVDHYVLLNSPFSKEGCAISESETEVHLIGDIEFIPDSLSTYFKERFNFYIDFSKQNKSYKYYANHCRHCGVIHGDFYLHSRADSPFFIYSKEDAEKLLVHKITLPYDIEVNGSIEWSDRDEMIVAYSQFIDDSFIMDT